MNDYRQLPRKGPTSPQIIKDQFKKTYPIYWGPNQRIKEDDVYVEPDGFVHNRVLAVPKVARFITDAHEEDATQQPSCTFEKGFLFPVPANVPVFAVTFRRIIGATFEGGLYWIDCPEAEFDPSADPVGRGISQYVNANTGELIIIQPDIRARNPAIASGNTGAVVTKPFSEVFSAGNTEIYFYALEWRWFNVALFEIGQTFRYSPFDLVPWQGTLLLTPVDTDPICPDEYQTGCPCLP